MSVSDHANVHFELYEKHGKVEDLCAYYMLSGKSQDPEFVRMVAHLGGIASYKKRIEMGIGHMPYFGADITKERMCEISSSGGKIQGKRNVESGHMNNIQKLVDHVANGKKAGAKTMLGGKGSFADPVERLKAASAGGKKQGKINSENGHLKKISEDYWKDVREGAIVRKKRFWITNGEESLLLEEGCEIPENYYVGRVIKK